MKVWAGVDPGEKRVGVARCDALGMLAHPIGIAKGREELAAWLLEWQESHNLDGVVVGVPRNMDGSYGPMARRSMDLVTYLREQVHFSVFLWDERLTTAQVTRQRGGKRREEAIDHEVAAVILQSYLDAGCPPVPDPSELRISTESSDD